MIDYYIRMQYVRGKVYSALRSSESFFKTDMVYLTKGGFWMTFSQIIVSISSFCVAIAFAHFVSKESYGQYKYILSIANILTTFSLVGIGSALVRSVAQGHEGTLKFAFWKNLQWSIFVFLGSLVVSVYYFLNDNNSIAIAMLIVGSLSPILSSANLYNAFLIGKKDFRRNSIYFIIIGNIFPSLCLLATITITNDPTWLIAVYFLSNTLIALFLYKRVLKIYAVNNSIDKESLVYAKHMSFINILAGIANNIDQILIFHYIGSVELAIYNFAVAIPNQTKGPLRGIGSLMFPKFVERSEQEIHAGMKNKLILLFITGIILTVGYIISAPFIYHIFFPKYESSIIFSQIFALSFIFIAFLPADAYLKAKGKVREQYILNTITSIAQIALIFIGIVWGGLLGLVIAKVIVRGINSITSFVLYKNSINKAF